MRGTAASAVPLLRDAAAADHQVARRRSVGQLDEVRRLDLLPDAQPRNVLVVVSPVVRRAA